MELREVIEDLKERRLKMLHEAARIEAAVAQLEEKAFMAITFPHTEAPNGPARIHPTAAHEYKVGDVIHFGVSPAAAIAVPAVKEINRRTTKALRKRTRTLTPAGREAIAKASRKRWRKWRKENGK